MKRAHVYYSGTVQGVGFRFTVERLARKADITGWIKNLPDARVELVGEGDEGALKDFLKNIITGPLKYYIRHTEISWSEATGEFSAFKIRF